MNIAILGYGTVGGGVHAILRDGNLGIHVKRVLDIRSIGGLPAGLQTDNIGDIIADPTIDCVVEAIGGIHPALSYVTVALRAGKHVVTSNKELISKAFAPLLLGARSHQAQIRFSASVGGGIPWIHNLLRHKRGDKILSIHGNVNGTANFILDAMGHGSTFEDALHSARLLGYAEVDVTDDIDGIDTQRKCAISASLAFDTLIETPSIPTLGIRNVTSRDISAFSEKRLTCKLMMYAECFEHNVCAYVEPTLLTEDSLAAFVPTNYNCVTLCAEHAGRLSFVGEGAGRFPTAVNIALDLLDISLHTNGLDISVEESITVGNDRERHAYYVRTDCPRMLQGVLKPLGEGFVTQPASVPEMHAMAKEILRADPGAFFAGIPEP